MRTPTHVAGPAAAYAVRCEAQALAVRHGNHAAAAGYQAGLCQDLFWAGRWDEASALIDEITRRGDLGSLTRDALWLAATETLLLCETDGATALSRSAWMEATLSPRGTLDERSYCLSARAAAQVNAGQYREGARRARRIGDGDAGVSRVVRLLHRCAFGH